MGSLRIPTIEHWLVNLDWCMQVEKLVNKARGYLKKII